MSMSDPIADMLTRIRNAQKVKKPVVELEFSGVKEAIAKVLKKEGYIEDYAVVGEIKKVIKIALKYFDGLPVIKRLVRISKPSLRVYEDCNVRRVMSGLGVAIISTSQGVMSDRQARLLKVGGEILCEVE